MNQLTPVALAAALLLQMSALQAQQATESGRTLSTVNVNASADASAQGLSPAFSGGQVARGGRAGILGTKDNMETPFAITSYTNELIQDRQARSVGDVLQNDPNVRVARGFGNFQEAYFIRGLLLSSDDVAYNGLFGLLPRQYIATELFERVEVLRGASTFTMGANPGGQGLGGSINLLPKRAPNEPLSRVTLSAGSGSNYGLSADIARRFGPDGATGIRVNAAVRDGGTAVDGEDNQLGLVSVGLDWRSRSARVSADIGYQDNKLKNTRPNVSTTGLTVIPRTPDNERNFAQPWSYSNERDTFGTLRGEFDITDNLTAWGAYGLRRSDEANSLANFDTANGATGAGSFSRFDNTRKDEVDTFEFGLRGKARTGSVGHEWVIAASSFGLDKKNAFAADFGNAFANNLYSPVTYPQPAFTAGAMTFGSVLANPQTTGRTKLTSLAIGDTLSLAGDTVLLTLGARHQNLLVTSNSYVDGSETGRYDKSRTSPMVAGVWKVSKQFSAYANYAEGLTQGETAATPFGGLPPANLGEQLEPYVTKQTEIGVKYDGGSFGGGLAFFNTKKPRAFINAANVFTASGEDKHQGVELNVYGQPVKGLRVLGGATWLNAKQESTGAAATDGKRVIGVPKFQANVGAEWDVPGVQGLALDARVVHTGSSYADAANTLGVSGWSRLDLGARYLMEVQGRVVTLRARIDNATDKAYWGSVGGFAGAGYLVLAQPRTFNVSASVDF
ncbi:MAG: TonB-dependent receptor [Burkholderiaceae bacterium]